MDKVVGLLLLLLAAVRAKIELVGNGYEGVAVSISPEIEVNPDLLLHLENILSNGSASLFRATKNQVYFREFIFAVPESWPRQDHYEDALDLELDEPDIIVDKPNAATGDTPYVRSYATCGRGGKYMHLTPTYILDDTVRKLYGRPGITITHEWAHLRYGVFDEYPQSPQERFYRLGQEWYPTKCSFGVTGEVKNKVTGEPCRINRTTDRPEDDCRFMPFIDTPAVASLMYGNQLNNIEEFCDDPITAPDHLKHNLFANNLHNKQCGSRSVWDVMRLHPDFQSLSNQAPLPNDTDTRPRFRYVQAHPRKRVLVLDTSGSMQGDPLTGLRLAASNFILSTVETRSYLGIVGFGPMASTYATLVQIQTDSDREHLVNALPTSAGGGTSIGAGLRLGVEALADLLDREYVRIGLPHRSGYLYARTVITFLITVLNQGGVFSGGSIILITDGEENTAPFIDEVTAEILQADVVVHSLSYGQSADPKIAYLSRITGGGTSFYSGSAGSTGLLDGFANAISKGSSLMSSKDISIPILTEASTVTPDSPLAGSFYIDSTIGNDTTLTFSFTGFINVEVKSPDGPYNGTTVKEISNPSSPAKVLRVALQNDLTPGLWSYNVTTTSISVSVLVNIQSKPRRQGQGVIQTNSWLSQKEDISFSGKSTLGVYAEVLRGKTPVLGASVVATMETPLPSTFDLVLKDNGLGFDVIKDDGIYSAVVIATDFSGNGRYNVKVKVNGTKESTTVFVAETASGNNADRVPTLGSPEVNTKTETLEGFQRVTATGEFRLNGYTTLVEDIIPPGRIVDLEATTYDGDNYAATLEWTAVGGNLDRGQAARYIIYKSLNVSDVIDNATSVSVVLEGHVLEGNLSSPLSSGQREKFVVFLQELNVSNSETVYMTISAVDEAGNEGEISNLAIVSDAREIAFNEEVVEDEDSDDDDDVDDWVYVVIGLAVAFVVIVIIIVIAVLLWRRNKST